MLTFLMFTVYLGTAISYFTEIWYIYKFLYSNWSVCRLWLRFRETLFSIISVLSKPLDIYSETGEYYPKIDY